MDTWAATMAGATWHRRGAQRSLPFASCPDAVLPLGIGEPPPTASTIRRELRMLPQFQRRSRRATLALGPDEFARAIAVEKRRWRKDLSGLPGHAIRRRVRHLARRLSGAYLRLNPGVSIPSAAAMGFAFQTAWDVPNAEDIKVVILPRGAPGDASGVDQGEGAGVTATGTVRPNPRAERKELKVLLRSLTTEYRRTRFELTFGRRARARARYAPQVGTLSIGGSRTERALYLEALGAVICTGLSEGDADRLRGQGVRVIDNVPMALVDTPKNEGKPQALGSRTPSAEDLWHRNRVGADGMHSKGCSGKGVTIGLLDTGIDAGHPEFAGKQIRFAAFGKDGGHLPHVRAKDYHTHGTSVGSICAGRNVGIAPGADIAVAAVLTERDGAGRPVGYVAQILRGLNWLAEGGFGLPGPVDLINAALGLYAMEDTGREDFGSVVEEYRVGGLLMVAAIGNQGRMGSGNHATPGNFGTVLGVGAVDRADVVAPFSSWGSVRATADGPAFDKPDLSAPGVAIVSAIPRPRYSKQGALYDACDGTSMASPIVAGCAALLVQADESLRGQPDDLCDILLSLTSRSTGWDDPLIRSRCGKGVLDLRTFSDKMGHSHRNG